MLGLLAAVANPAQEQLGFVPPAGAKNSNVQLVVERVATGLAADKAGIRKGDVLQNWKNDLDGGPLDSAFQIFSLQTEQAPRAPVFVAGRRGDEDTSWVFGPGDWGLIARPDFPPVVLAQYEEGARLAKEGNAHDAAKLWRSLALNAQDALPEPIRTWLLFNGAEALSEAKEFSNADEQYQQSIDSLPLADTQQKAIIEKIWADRLLRRRDWDKASKLFEEILRSDAADRIQHPLFAASAFHGLGLISYFRSDLAQARRFDLDSLALRQKAAPGSLAVAASLQNLSAIAIDQGELDEAKDWVSQALQIRERLVPESLLVTESFHNLGNILFTRGDLTEAESNFQKALIIAQHVSADSVRVSDNLNSLGTIAKERGDLTLAEDFYLRALSFQEKLAPDSLEIVATLNNLGGLASYRHEYNFSENYFRRAMEIVQRIGPDSESATELLANIAGIALERGDWNRAETLYTQALEKEQKLAPDGLNTADTFDDLGELALKRGNTIQAREFLEKASVIQEKLAPKTLSFAQTLAALGDLSRDQHELPRAKAYYQQAIGIQEKLSPGSRAHAETLAALASLRMSEHAYPEASQLFETALNALESQAARLGGAESTRTTFRRNEERYYREYVELLLLQGEPLRALEILERSRARTLLEILAEAHVDLRSGVDPTLLHKERTLSRSIELKLDRRAQLMTEEHSDHQLAVLKRELEDMLRQFAEVEGQIRTTSPMFASLTQPQPLTVGDLRREALDANTVLIEFSLGENASHVWLVSDRKSACFPLPRRQVIEALARRFYEQLRITPSRVGFPHKGNGEVEPRSLPDQAISRTARELSAMILGPVMQDISGDSKRLLIVPDGLLNYVPFGALPVAGNDAKSVPLIVRHEIVTAPSASVVAFLRNKSISPAPPHSRSVLIFADPVFDRNDVRVQHTTAVALKVASGESQRAAPDASVVQQEDSSEELTRSISDLSEMGGGRKELPRLLYSREEAAGILSVSPSGLARAALDFKASRAEVLSSHLEDYRVLHFATHAMIDDRHPELSGLVLSLVNPEGKVQNGFLNLQEIYNLNLHAELVVLSACETALGQDAGGEGFIGLTRGFFHAGADLVISSLWNVSDVATAELMRKFYRFMEIEGLDPAAALRHAQLEMMKQERWSAPYFWAAFQASGVSHTPPSAAY
jgi:CHAT domain-containing protein/tetratricopeptide (TPR) repeat protein